MEDKLKQLEEENELLKAQLRVFRHAFEASLTEFETFMRQQDGINATLLDATSKLMDTRFVTPRTDRSVEEMYYKFHH